MIELENIRKSYGSGENRSQALRGVSCEICGGEFTVVLGASGSGKSTLLNIASGLERPDSGCVRYDGLDIACLSDTDMTAFRRKNVGFVFQQYYLLPNMTVDRNVRMGAELAGKSDYRLIIDAVGLGGKLNKYPGQLSGGEQQRVSIARALAKMPSVLFLDEPTGALDEETGRQVLDYVSGIQREWKFTMVMVTHNVNIAEMADTIVLMNSGEIIERRKNERRKSAFEIGW